MENSSLPYVPPPGGKSPRKGMSPLGIALIVIVSGLAAAGGWFAVKEGTARREARDEADRKIHDTLNEAQDDLRKQLEKEGSITNTREFMQKVRSGFDSAGSSLQGEDAKMARASSRFFQHLQEAGGGMEKLAKRLEQEEVFDVGKVKDRERLVMIRKLGRDLIAESDSLLKIALTSDKLFAKLMQEEGVGEAMSRGAIKGMKDVSSRQEPLIRRVRGADTKIGHSMVELADLLESEWGKWSAASDGITTFQNAAAADKLNKILADMQAAAADQSDAQKQLVEKMGKRR